RSPGPGPRPAGQVVASDVQSPSKVWSHQVSAAACAATMFSSMPHLQAAQRRISWVVPVNWPFTRGAMSWSARGSSPPGKKLPPRPAPLAWLAPRFIPLFSAIRLARTHAAHSAPEGSPAPGGRVPKCAGTGGGATDAGALLGVADAVA